MIAVIANRPPAEKHGPGAALEVKETKKPINATTTFPPQIVSYENVQLLNVRTEGRKDGHYALGWLSLG